MFIKTCITKRKNKTYKYYQIVKSFREDGKVKHKVLSNLGYLSEKNIDTLIQGLNRLKENPIDLLNAELTSKKILAYGDIQVLIALWNRLGISEMINRHLERNSRVTFDLASYALLMTIHRLIHPASKLALTNWFMKIDFPYIHELDYQKILRSLAYLYRIKDFMEVDLFQAQKDLFNLEVDLIFYDITSTYFEGAGPYIARKGYSRDMRPDRNQIVLALALTQDGLPVGHETYSGNTSDKSTVQSIIEKLKKRFNISRCIFVGDRGMVSDKNIEYLTENGYEYIFALRKRRLRETKNKFESDLNKYGQFNTSTVDGQEQILYYLEYPIDENGIRYIVCHNEEIATSQREKADKRVEKIEKTLKDITKNSKKGFVTLKQASKITLIDRFFEYGLTEEGDFYYQQKKDALKFEKNIAGKFILKTGNQSLKAEEIIAAYKNLNLVESAFRDMKGFIEIRPIYHRSDEHVLGHVFICVLSFLLQRMLEKYFFKPDGTRITAKRILEKLSEVKVVENELNGNKIGSIVETSGEIRKILKKLQIPVFGKTTILLEKKIKLPKKVEKKLEKYTII